MSTTPIAQLGAEAPRKPEIHEVTDLLRDLNALRVDPHATDLDWLLWFEAKAALLTRIAQDSGSPTVRELAAEAWQEADQRRTRLELDGDSALSDSAVGGASGRW